MNNEEEIIEKLKQSTIERYYIYKGFEGKGMGANPKRDLMESIDSTVEYLKEYCERRRNRGNNDDDDLIDICRRNIVASLRALKEIEKEEAER